MLLNRSCNFDSDSKSFLFPIMLIIFKLIIREGFSQRDFHPRITILGLSSYMVQTYLTSEISEILGPDGLNDCSNFLLLSFFIQYILHFSSYWPMILYCLSSDLIWSNLLLLSLSTFGWYFFRVGRNKGYEVYCSVLVLCRNCHNCIITCCGEMYIQTYN